MKLILGSLGILVILSLLSVLFGNDLIGVQQDIYIYNGILVTEPEQIEFIESQPYLSGQWVQFNINALTGALAVIIALITVASLVGIQILGSGLSEQTVRVLMLATVYVGMWALFSVLSYALISGIELFGGVIYIGLTIAYAVGVIQKMASSD